MDLFFAYLAGLLTLINPCVLPILPIVLTSSLGRHKAGPLAMAAGMSVAFVALGLVLSVFGRSLGISEEMVAQVAAIFLLIFGVILFVPKATGIFATMTSGFAARADTSIDAVEQKGLGGQFLVGVLMGAVWSPCIGPTLGGAIALASQGENLFWAGSIMVSFALGVSTVFLALAYGARKTIARRNQSLRKMARWARPLTGVVFILVGLMILTKFYQRIEFWAIENLPAWLIDLSVSL